MPITQSRMIALINAGRDYKQAYESTRAAIEVHFQSANNSEETFEQALEAVWSHTKPAIIIQNLNSAAVLEVEHHHFKSFRSRNNRAAKASRRRRNNLADIMSQPDSEPTQRMPQSTAPESAIRPEQPKHARITNNTDSEQVQSDSEIEFDISEPTPEAKDAINKFLQNLEKNK